MIVYNVTISIDAEVEAEWVEWMKKTHIPDVMKTGHFESFRFLKLTTTTDQDEKTYAIQYQCEKIISLETYQEKHAPILQLEHQKRYKNRFVAFRTILEDI